MRSPTAYPLRRGEIDELVRHMLGSSVRVARARSLRGGLVHSCLQLRMSDGHDIVLKVAPPPSYTPLCYERDAMRGELEFYRQVARARVPVPTVLGTSLGGAVIESDAFLMSRVPGYRLSMARWALSRRELAEIRRELGRIASAIASIRGDHFGYASRQPSADSATWRDAFTRMVGGVLADASRLGISLPRPARAIAALVRLAAPALDAVTSPRLVHFDLWDGNVMVERRGGRARVSGILDGERAFWGDPYAELASLSFHRNLERDDDPGLLDATTRTRIALGQLYLYLIQVVETAVRGGSAVVRWLGRQHEGVWLCRATHDIESAVRELRR